MKSTLRKLIQKTGFDFKRIPIDPNERRHIDLLRKYGIDVVFDIGANAGQYGRHLRAIGYKGKIVSFEPQPDAFLKLEERAATDPNWTVVKTAVGDEAREIELNVANNSYSSSVLDMLPLHLESAPQSAYINKIIVPLTTVDTIIDQYKSTASELFIKIDTQGFEEKVFRGCLGSLDKIRGFQMELSMVPLYKGELLMPDMVTLLDGYGYKLMLMENGLRQPQTSELLQVEGYFCKPVNS